MPRHLSVLFVVLCTSVTTQTFASTEPLRLIRTAQGVQWMNAAQISNLVRESHRAGHCGGFMDITANPAVSPWPQRIEANRLPQRPAQMAIVKAILPMLSAEALTDTVRTLSSAPFKNRYYNNVNGASAAEWIKDAFEQLAGDRPGITVELFTHDFLQASVIVRFAGQGEHAREKVIIGAHEDSINWQGLYPIGDEPAPGADDNASGVATLLEIFRVLLDAKFQPERTLEFIAYAGEEAGLLGSQDIANAYRRSRQNVVAVMQLDMTMWPGHGRKIQLISDNTHRALTRFTAQLIDTYIQAPWQDSPCGYACSDHASWDRVGYATVFPFEAPLHQSNPNVHTAADTLENNLDGSYGLEFAKLGTAFAVELTRF